MWGLIAALYIGNVMLMILNLPMVGVFVRILNTPMYLLLPLIMMVSVVGVYSANHAILDLVLLCVFGVTSYFMRRNGFPIAPVILGFVLGGRMEALRQSMITTKGGTYSALSNAPSSPFFSPSRWSRWQFRSSWHG